MKIREKRVIREDGSTDYVYFARCGADGRKWVDLTPYGNRVPEKRA